MTAEEIAVLPARPESVVEWEDLLVRLEIVPRVVRNSVEEVVEGEGAARALAQAVAREGRVGEWLEAASGTPEPRARLRGDSPPGEVDPAGLAFRFASLRARTFAMVQRRGLEVWEWGAPLDGEEKLTVHQMLLWLSRRDADLLVALREATRAGVAGC